MGELLVFRLRAVEREYLAVRSSLAHVERRANLLAESEELAGRSLHDIRTALAGLETTYTLRLFAEFEGVLRDCWAQRGRDPEEHRVDYLIDHVGLAHMDAALRQRVHEVQHHRNALVHRIRPRVPPLSFAEARKRLAKYLDRLPDPTD